MHRVFDCGADVILCRFSSFKMSMKRRCGLKVMLTKTPLCFAVCGAHVLMLPFDAKRKQLQGKEGQPRSLLGVIFLKILLHLSPK